MHLLQGSILVPLKRYNGNETTAPALSAPNALCETCIGRYTSWFYTTVYQDQPDLHLLIRRKKSIWFQEVSLDVLARQLHEIYWMCIRVIETLKLLHAV